MAKEVSREVYIAGIPQEFQPDPGQGNTQDTDFKEFVAIIAVVIFFSSVNIFDADTMSWQQMLGRLVLLLAIVFAIRLLYQKVRAYISQRKTEQQ